MRRLWTPQWALVHVGLVIVVAGCLALGWWQLQRAASGNLLSYGYAIQWPAFAVFAVFVWIKELRKAVRGADASATVPSGATPADQGRPDQAPADQAPADQGRPDLAQPQRTRAAPARTSRQQPRSGPAYDDSGDSQLAAYNHYLAWLNANPNANPASYPGPARSEEKT